MSDDTLDDDLDADAIREMAATRFEPIPIDPSAFAADKWAKRSFEEGVLSRLVVAVLGKDDLELASGIHDDAMADAVSSMMEQFHAQEQHHIGAAEVFRSGAARLAIALSRYTYQLDRDGIPLPRN